MFRSKPKEKGQVQRVVVDGREYAFHAPQDATDADKAAALVKLLDLTGTDRLVVRRIDALDVELANANAKIDRLGQAIKMLRKREKGE